MLPNHKSTIGKLIRLPFRLLPSGREVRLLRGPGRGKRWISNAAANGYWLGFWELESQRRFAACLKPGDVLYEIGAHVGLYVLGAGEIGPTGHIYAFEPLERNLRFLRRHVELNRLSNCTIVEAAVCKRSGTRRLDATVCHSEARLSETGAIVVDVTSVDEFVFGGSGHSAPTIMHIDAPTAEMEILSGACRTIQQYAPRVLLSTYSSKLESECSALLSSLRYRLRVVAPGVLFGESTAAVKQQGTPFGQKPQFSEQFGQHC